MLFSFSLFKTASRKASSMILLLLFFLVPGVACATIYECREPDGVLFLTNNQDNIPPDCQQTGGPTEEKTVSRVTPSSVAESTDGSINSRQAIPSQKNQSRPENSKQATASFSEGKTGISHQVELNDLQRIVQSLVNRYQTVQNSTMSPSEKAAALEKMEKYVWAVHQSLDSSNISGEDREKLEAMLSSL